MEIFERTFDNASIDYDKIRPIYIKEIYDDIFNYKQINSESHVLEIGMGTGKATQPILDTKCHFIGIEPGKHLADLAKKRFQKYENFSLYNCTLQDFVYSNESFDFIYAATAFHWITEEYGYKRVYKLLKNGGIFARFAYHAGIDKGRKVLTTEIQELYSKYMYKTTRSEEYCEDDARKIAEMANEYGFVDVKYKLYYLTKDFTANEYMALLRTYPDHMAIDKSNREKLFNGIYSAINRNGGILTVNYTMDLELARKPY